MNFTTKCDLVDEGAGEVDDAGGAGGRVVLRRIESHGNVLFNGRIVKHTSIKRTNRGVNFF